MKSINGVEFPDPEPVLLQTTLLLAEKAVECGVGRGIAEQLGLAPYDPANLLDVLRVGGVRNALWCLRCVLPGQEEARDRVARLIAAECAARVLHIYEDRYPGDEQPRRAVEAARDFALGLIDAEALCAASDAACAASDAAWAASDAAWAARAAASDTICVAGAAESAACAAEAAAWSTARAATCVARAAAWAAEAAWAAADAAAWAAADAAAWAAWAAARDAEFAAQAEILRAYLKESST